MTMRPRKPRRLAVLRLLLAATLGVAAALLVACGSSGGNLIPVENAGPLQRDFEAVARKAREGNGNCGATEAAIRKTESDFHSLPSTVDAGLREHLEQGIQNLDTRARALCAQPLAQTTGTTSGAPAPAKTQTTSTTTTRTTPAKTQTTSTTSTTPSATTPTSTSTTPSTTTIPGSEGATPAPGSEEASSESESGNEPASSGGDNSHGAGNDTGANGTGGSGVGQ